MKERLIVLLIVFVCTVGSGGITLGQTVPPKKFQGFLGTYHPYPGTAYGGGGWTEGELMQTAFNFGQNAILNRGSHNGYTFEQNVNNSCSEWDVNKVYGILLPPSEFGVVNQPADTDLLKPFSKEPGMIQGMHRFSELSKRCPQLDGVIIDDLFNNFPKKISIQDLRDMRDALSGKHIDDKGNVDHSSPATTPDLNLYFVVYEHELDRTPNKEVLDLIDGVSFWVWKQSANYKNFDDYIKTVQRLYPGKEIITGVYVRSSGETPTVASVHYIMDRSFDLYTKGEVNGLLIFSAIWLSRERSERDRWNELALPEFLGRHYYPFLGEATGRVVDAKAKKPIPHALVTIDRLVDGKSLNVAKKFTNERGEYRFGGWVEGNRYKITVTSETSGPKTLSVRLRVGEVLRLPNVGLKK